MIRWHKGWKIDGLEVYWCNEFMFLVASLKEAREIIDKIEGYRWYPRLYKRGESQE